MPKKREAKPLLLKNQTQKRRDRAQELRSARRQGVLAKRRKLDVAQTPGEAEQPESWSREQLASTIQGVRVSPMPQILPFLVDLRKMLSLEDPPVEEVVEGEGLAPRLVELLRTPNDEIQIEAAWCLTNIASSWSRHTEKILGATPQLITFLSAPNPALQEQALWALGNIAGDSSDFRAMLHANGALLPIFRLLQQPPSIEIARTAAWAVSNLARGNDTAGEPFLAVAPIVVECLRGRATPGAPRDDPLRVEAAWVLAFLTAKEEETASALIRAGMVPALVEALVDSGGRDPLCTPALRALGNMVSGAQDWADAVMVHKEFLPCLDAVLKIQDDKSRRALVKEAAWVASNVAAGRQEHRDALVAQGSLAALTSLLVSDQLDLQQEAAYGIWNIASHSQEILVQASKNEKVIGAFVALVRAQSAPVVRCALSFLQIICQNVPGGPRVVEMAGGLEAIDDVHYSGQADPDLQAAAGSIVDKFYGEDGYASSDEDGDGDAAEGGQQGGGGGGGDVRWSGLPHSAPGSFLDQHRNQQPQGGGGVDRDPAAVMPQGHQMHQQQQQQQQQGLAPLGRGAHLTRPAWMNQS